MQTRNVIGDISIEATRADNFRPKNLSNRKVIGCDFLFLNFGEKTDQTVEHKWFPLNLTSPFATFLLTYIYKLSLSLSLHQILAELILSHYLDFAGSRGFCCSGFLVNLLTVVVWWVVPAINLVN